MSFPDSSFQLLITSKFFHFKVSHSHVSEIRPHLPRHGSGNRARGQVEDPLPEKQFEDQGNRGTAAVSDSHRPRETAPSRDVGIPQSMGAEGSLKYVKIIL